MQSVFFYAKKNRIQSDLEKELFKLGFIKEDENEYLKRTNGMMTLICFLEDKVKIKVYADAYSESNTLQHPFTKKEFITFIEQNEI